MKTPTETLREEHRVILRALDLLERAAERGAADPWWLAALGWLAAFADHNHHAKEEVALFPALAKAGVPSDDGPVAVMLEEHVEGRRLIEVMRDRGGAERGRACREYVALLRAHIDKENEFVFPLADAVLDAQAQAGLQREFETVEAEHAGDAGVAAGAAAVDRLAAALERGH